MLKTCEQCGNSFDAKEERHRFCNKSCAAKFTNAKNQRFAVQPEELHRLVWSMPVTKVAEQFGVTDNAIIKRCRNWGIPNPPVGYWQRLEVEKCDRAGNLTIPLISCACGCGSMVPKWSGKKLRPRRCVFGHNITHHAGGWFLKGGPRGSRRVDPNVVAIVSCRKDWNDDLTKLVTGIVLAITHRHFDEYLGPVWEAVSAAVAGGQEDADALTVIAKDAIKDYWREIRGRSYAHRSIDAVFSKHRIDITVAPKEPDPFDV
jgi:hypothetical protein